MKICKLKLKGLNSFREEVEIDFEKSPLDDASLVAITGPTGSGKNHAVRRNLRSTLWENPAIKWDRESKSESTSLVMEKKKVSPKCSL